MRNMKMFVTVAAVFAFGTTAFAALISRYEGTEARPYYGFLTDKSGNMAGSIELSVAKVNKRTELCKFKATIIYGEKKETVSGSVDVNGVAESTQAGLPKLKITEITNKRFKGTYGDYNVQGCLNLFKLKKNRSAMQFISQYTKNISQVQTACWWQNDAYSVALLRGGAKGKITFKGYTTLLKNEGAANQYAAIKTFSAKGQLVIDSDSGFVFGVTTGNKKGYPVALLTRYENGEIDRVSAAGEMNNSLRVSNNFKLAAGDWKIVNDVLNSSLIEAQAQGATEGLAPKVVVAGDGSGTIDPKKNAVNLKFKIAPKYGYFQGAFKDRVNNRSIKIVGYVVDGYGYGLLQKSTDASAVDILEK